MHFLITFLLFFSINTAFPASISEKSDYPEFCQQVAEDANLFQIFKSHPRYQHMLEHVSYTTGVQYLEAIEKKYPFILEQIEKHKENDKFGSPDTYFFGKTYGILSPTTLRYMKVAGDLFSLFGSLEGQSIIEIGVGYGGQCKILSNLWNFDKYTLIDLPEACQLAKLYLAKLDIKNVCFFGNQEISQPMHCDLLISNYAFSEISSDEQLNYIKHVINGARNGYMTCNFISDHFSIHSLSLEELLRLLQKPGREVSILPEEPNTHLQNVIVTWKELPSSH
ncbi:MAG: putative sugar O-methyltransferase [Chlamydiae bacterium]|nr:putative sugar O-methyltransferase [Chlamydiota bacterium]